MESAQVAESMAATRDVVAGDPKAALLIALAEAFHQSGVPSDELEQVMHRVAGALELELQVTALPTSITAAIGPAYAQKVVLLRLEPGVVDLRRLSLLNMLSDRIVQRRIALDTALADTERIAALGHASRPLWTLFAYGMLSLGASVVLGGHGAENVAAGFIGIATGAIAVAARYVPTIDRLFEILAAFVATIVVTLFGEHVTPISVYVPIVAGVVQLLPGLQLTTALHELAFRNYVAGTARLGSVLMTLLSLGCGFALGLAVVGTSAMHVMPAAHPGAAWWTIALAVVAVATAIAILERARPVDYPWVLGSCAVAELAYRVFALSPGSEVVSFGASLVVGLLANLGARYARIPQAVLLIPGLLILVPGSLSYESILYVLQSDARDAGTIALNAIVAAVEIVSGLLFAQLLFSPDRRPRSR